MKLLIIAGPYEADRLRKAAVSAGFETVAVEAGESLSGWISASRPDLIVMAPQIVSPDPTVALAKVRAVPRGRVPTFLVGDPEDEPFLKGLADGFFARPVSPDDLIAKANALLDGGSTSAEGVPQRRSEDRSGILETPATGRGDERASEKAAPNLKPLVAENDAPPPPGLRSAAIEPESAREPGLRDLDASIEASLDADIREAIRGLTARARAGTPVGRPRHASGEIATAGEIGSPAPAAAAENGTSESGTALRELRDESSQKTLEVPRDVVARMATADADGAARGLPAPSESGHLMDQDVPTLLGRIYTRRLTGWLTVRQGTIEKAIVFDRGAPILAGSNLPGDRMGDMLVRQGRLTVQQQAASVDVLRATGRRLGVVLVESGFIKAGELASLVRRHFEEIIYSLFGWETGEWSTSPDRPEKEETVLLTAHPAALILEGIRRKYRPARLRACLGGGRVALRLTRQGGLSAFLDEMDLSDDERRVLGLYDGIRSLDDIVARAGVDEAAALGVAWALSVLGRLAPGAEIAGALAREAAQANGGERDREIDRLRILARHALVREGDYFQILGVPRDAGPHEIRRAHEGLAREMDPRSLAPGLAADLAEPLAAIATVVAEGARVLGDERLRALYQRHLPDAGPERSA